LSARRPRLDNKFLVAITVGLFAVAGQEVEEARTHVTRQMLDEYGDAIGFVIELQKKIFIAQLHESAFRQALVSAQAAQGFLEISGANVVVHGTHLNGGSGVTEKLSTARLQQLLSRRPN